MKWLIFLLIILECSMVFASSYSIEFNQIDNSVVVKEVKNDVKMPSYVDNSLIEKTSSGIVFIKKVSFNESFDIVSVKLNLDEGYLLGNGGAYPDDYSTLSDGTTISFSWNRTNIHAGESLSLFADLKDVDKDSIIPYFILVVVLLAVLFFFFRNHIKKKKASFDKYLLDIERSILAELRKSNRHELWQKNIQNKLSLSKAKTSRMIRNLETRGLIEKIPFGNTNKIRLK